VEYVDLILGERRAETKCARMQQPLEALSEVTQPCPGTNQSARYGVASLPRRSGNRCSGESG